MVNNTKGTRRERQLAQWFDEHGWAVIRAPASGSATERELPDLFVGEHGTLYAMEVKASAGDPIYINEVEVVALKWFSRHFAAQARLVAVFDEQHGDPTYGHDDIFGAYVFDPADCHRTDGGNYRIKKETAFVDGRLLTEL